MHTCVCIPLCTCICVCTYSYVCTCMPHVHTYAHMCARSVPICAMFVHTCIYTHLLLCFLSSILAASSIDLPRQQLNSIRSSGLNVAESNTRSHRNRRRVQHQPVMSMQRSINCHTVEAGKCTSFWTVSGTSKYWQAASST